MKSKRKIERILKEELNNTLPNAIWEIEEGGYEVFGKYRILPHDRDYKVTKLQQKVGIFNSTKAALSWCIADKFNLYELSKELLMIEHKLFNLNNDIEVRSSIANKSDDDEFCDMVSVKLEAKIHRKEQLEERLVKCVNYAKYWQQRGFLNETARPC